jgi:hypothetical protein
MSSVAGPVDRPAWRPSDPAIGVHELIFDFRGRSIAESIERLQPFAAEVIPLTTG